MKGSDWQAANLRMIMTGLIKKALRKFEWPALRNEIDDTKAWTCYQSVSRTKAGTYSNDRTNFILAGGSNF
jgi:hypothetical protein